MQHHMRPEPQGVRHKVDRACHPCISRALSAPTTVWLDKRIWEATETGQTQKQPERITVVHFRKRCASGCDTITSSHCIVWIVELSRSTAGTARLATAKWLCTSNTHVMLPLSARLSEARPLRFWRHLTAESVSQGHLMSVRLVSFGAAATSCPRPRFCSEEQSTSVRSVNPAAALCKAQKQPSKPLPAGKPRVMRRVC